MTIRNNRDFLRDPVGFTQNRPVYIAVRPHDTVLKPHPSYQSVDSRSRVIYWDINLDEDEDIYCVTMGSEPVDDALPGFWLPWSVNQTNKITLHDKRAIKERGPPLAFFTDTLTGCSIFVQGNRQTPTVYHTNARDETFGNSEPRRKAHRAAIQEARLNRFDPPKRGGGHERVVHAKEYMIDAHPDAQRRLAQQYRFMNVDPDSVLSRTEAGVIFGVRGVAQPWAFYLHGYVRLVVPGREGRSATIWQSKGTEEIASPRVGQRFRGRGGQGTTEIGASGRPLWRHVDRAISTYAARWHFNQSAETREALRALPAAKTRGYLTLLSVVHHYLGLDAAPAGFGLGPPLKRTAEFYDDLRLEYERWLSR